MDAPLLVALSVIREFLDFFAVWESCLMEVPVLFRYPWPDANCTCKQLSERRCPVPVDLVRTSTYQKTPPWHQFKFLKSSSRAPDLLRSARFCEVYSMSRQIDGTINRF
jgi:hypothetical protein